MMPFSLFFKSIRNIMQSIGDLLSNGNDLMLSNTPDKSP